MDEETHEGDDVQPDQRFGQPLVVTRQAAKAAGPGDIPFDDPALGQQDEAVRAFGLLDHDQLDAVLLGCRSRCTRSLQALRDAVKLFVYAWNRRQLHLRAHPRYPADVFHFVYP